ncbi:MAG TPA: fibronectin type III domain-containing protein [Anaeromyxobacteraceae bacterium]|nr:fibronectin type III domain-containing protein [Anaeromyxobacteraceae bacterium]
MLRRAALLVSLVLPCAAAAQTTASMSFSTSTIDKDQCGNASVPFAVNFTVGTPASFDFSTVTFQVREAKTSDCSGTENSDYFVLTGTPVTSGATGTYPPASVSFTANDVTNKVGLTCNETADQTITFCVKLMNGGTEITTSGYTQASGTVTVQLGVPPKPTITSIQAGDKALFVYWQAGTGGTASSEKFSATAKLNGNAVSACPRTSATNCRIDGLQNGVTYTVTVTAYSSGGNPSPESDPMSGTAVPVDDFWSLYKKDGGREAGGCGAGGAGALALLGVAAALRRVRRRP